MQTPTPGLAIRGPQLFFGSGRKVDAFHFDADDLSPPLIGRALSRINRYSGNGDRSVSVAQHSYNLSFQVGDCPHRQRAALMHDVPEMFTGDVPTPIKLMCPDLLAIDDRIIQRVAFVYEVPLWAFETIHQKDKRISKDEAYFMFDHLDEAAVDQLEGGGGPLGIHIVPVTPEVAATSWTRRFYRLFREEISRAA